MAKQNLNNLKEESVGILSTLNDISKLIAQNADKLSKATGDSASTFRESFSASKKLADELLKLDEETLANAKERQKLEGQFRAVNSEINKLTAKRNAFLKQSNVATGQNQTLLKGIAQLYQDGINSLQEQVAETDKLARKFVDIEKNLGLTGKILEGINKIPILNKFIDVNKALEAANKEASSLTGSRWSVLGKALGSLGKGIKKNLTDPLVYIGIATTAFKQLVDIGFSYSKITADIAKNQGISSDQAALTQDRLRGIASASKDTLMTTNNLVEATNNLNNAFGTSADFSAKTLEDNLKLTKNLGLTVEEAAEYAKLSTLTGQTQEEIVNSIGKQRKGVISNRKVLAEVAKVNGQLFAQYKGSPELISKAVIQTQKLGMTLQQAQNASRQLLNFEESISAELEAELLTGRDINLEKARYLALQGDSAGAAQELMKNVGSLADFQRLNVIQQEALAKAAGMTVDELTDSLVKAQQIKELDQAQVKLYQQQIKDLRDKGQIEKANALEQQMMAGKSLELANVQADAQERLSRAGEKFKDTIASIVAGPVGALLEKVATVAEQLAGSPLGKIGLTTVAVTALAGGIAAFAKMFGSIAKNGAVPVTIKGGGPGLGGGGATGGGTGGGMGGALGRVGKAYKGGGFKGAAKSLGRMGKGLLKGGGKGLARMIPGAGALLSAGLEFADGGFTMENVGRAALSGGLGFLGGAAGTALLPGAGTIGGTVGGSMLGDYIGDAIFGEKPEPPAEDFIYRPGQKAMKFRKDDVVVGGTNLGGGGNGEVITLLKELVAAVKSGGDVYLDGTKVGTAMAMSTYKTQ
jgi:Flp pilus assembly protein TadG